MEDRTDRQVRRRHQRLAHGGAGDAIGDGQQIDVTVGMQAAVDGRAVQVKGHEGLAQVVLQDGPGLGDLGGDGARNGGSHEA